MNPDWIDFGIGKGLNLFSHPPGGSTAPGPERAIHWMRLFSTCCALLTLTSLFLLSKEVVPGQKRVQLAALAVVAFNPQFIYLSGLLNNDNLVAALATLALWQTARLLRCESISTRQALLLGLLFGLGMLAKPNMMFLAIPVAVVVWYRSPTVRIFTKRIAAIAAVALLISFWFYARNAWLYGDLDLLGWKTRAAIHPLFVLQPEQRWDFLAKQFVPYLFTSYWGRFGWLTLLLPWWQYVVYGLLSAAALMTLFPAAVNELRVKQGATLLLWVTVMLNLASLLAFNMIFLAEQGRLLFPSIAAFALLIAIGLNRLAGIAGKALQNIYHISLSVILFLLVLFSQWVVIRPVYFH